MASVSVNSGRTYEEDVEATCANATSISSIAMTSEHLYKAAICGLMDWRSSSSTLDKDVNQLCRDRKASADVLTRKTVGRLRLNFA